MILRAHLNNFEKRLLEDFKISSTLAATANLGNAREHFVRSFLRQHLGTNVGIGSGEIIDAKSETEHQSRNQMDVIVYSHAFPKIDFGDSGINIFMVESAIATLEIKSTLRKDELKSAFGAAVTLKALKKTAINVVSKPPALLIGKATPKWPHGMLNFVLAYDTGAKIDTIAKSWIPEIVSSLECEIPESDWETRRLKPAPAIDGIFVLGKGMILFDGNERLSPAGFSKEQRDSSHWIVVNQKSNNLLLLFSLLTAAISGLNATDYFVPDEAAESTWLQGWTATPLEEKADT